MSTKTKYSVASLSEIKAELSHLNELELKELCLKLARFKLDNKAYLSYLLFESENEQLFIENVKNFIQEEMELVNKSNYYLAKKGLRKILKSLKKFISFSKNKQTEVEILGFFCLQLESFAPSIFKNQTLTNLYIQQKRLAKKALQKLHPDLQGDFIQLYKID